MSDSTPEGKEIFQQMLWAVVIEPDGAQLPTRYYRWLAALAMQVRGDDNREIGPWARRDGGPGIIVQEGLIITASESFARQVAFMALDAFDQMEAKGELAGRFPIVSLGRIKLDRNLTRTRQDAAVIQRVEQVLGKRGRRPDPRPWAVTCTECCQVNPVETWRPVNCPNCGGMVIHSRPGDVVAYSDPGGDVVEAWMRTRFQGSHWEPAPVADHGLPAPSSMVAPAGPEEGTIELLKASDALLALVRTMPRDVAFEYLDAAFASRTYRSNMSRLEARVAAATEFFRQGGSPMGISLTEPADRLDLVDAAGVLGSEAVVAWLLTGESDKQ